MASAFEGVRGIVDPTNFGWPRQVEGLNGVVSIPSKPQRIVTASIGHDEMTVALVPVDRLVGVGGISKDPTYSNVASLVQDRPVITRDPETIIAQAPDVVVTSPFFPAEAIAALATTGIPVVQTELKHDPEARVNGILLMGYIFGEEERALEFAAEVRDRYDAIVSVTQKQEPRPRVLAVISYSDQLWVAGGGATEGGVIVAAGGINAAADAGVDGNQTTSLEGVIAMAPDVIIIPQPVAFWRGGVPPEPARQRGSGRGPGNRQRPGPRGREQVLHHPLLLEHPGRGALGPVALAGRLPRPGPRVLQPGGVTRT